MRVAQKFAGYSLEEADNLRKACGKKIRALIAAEREKFVAGCVTAGLRRGAGHAALRHHRAVRRLRLQQVALLRLRPRRLPDGLAQGALPGRVHVGAAHLGQGQQGQDGGVPGRVPLDGDRRAGARRQPLGGRVRTGPHGGDGARTDRRSSSAWPRCATWARAWWSGSWPSARPTAPSPTSSTSAPGRPRRAQQADDGVAGQGRRLRLARPPAPGAVPGPRGDRRPHPRAAPGAGARDHDALRRVRGGAGATRLGRRQGGHPRHRVRQGAAPGLREGDARALRERPPAHGLRGGAGPPHRQHAVGHAGGGHGRRGPLAGAGGRRAW